jgi:hypothetical protein
MESSFHSLIPFLAFLLEHLRLPSPELDPILDKNNSNDLLCPLITLGTDHAESTASVLLRRLVYCSFA